MKVVVAIAVVLCLAYCFTQKALPPKLCPKPYQGPTGPPGPPGPSTHRTQPLITNSRAPQSQASVNDANSTYLYNENRFLWLRHASGSPTKVFAVNAAGHMDLLSSVENAIIDIGTNHKPSFLKLASRKPGFLYIAIEPQPGPFKRMEHLVRGTLNAMGPFLTINAAVGPSEGFTTFNVSPIDFCSSLLAENSDGNQLDGRKKGQCFDSSKKITITVVSLDTLISYLPPRVQIYFVAIDAQGYDYY